MGAAAKVSQDRKNEEAQLFQIKEQTGAEGQGEDTVQGNLDDPSSSRMTRLTSDPAEFSHWLL